LSPLSEGVLGQLPVSRHPREIPCHSEDAAAPGHHLLENCRDEHPPLSTSGTLCWGHRRVRAFLLDVPRREAPVPCDVRVPHAGSVVLDEHYG